MRQNLFKSKLLPAVTLSSVDAGLFVAEAFLEAGLNVMEVTFRTKAAAQAITAIVNKFPEMNIGAGTILSSDQLLAAQNMRAQFGVSPGFNQTVASKAKELKLPFIPGVMTPSEIERALGLEFIILKLFPVNQIGGTEFIKKVEGPYRHTGVQFIPMGGINETNLASFLRCKTVLAAGGSWLAPKDIIEKRQFGKLTSIVKKSIRLAEKR